MSGNVTKRPVTTQEAILAGAISQALINRGEFAKGAFDRIFPQGVKADESGDIPHDKDALQGLVMLVWMCLRASRTAIDMGEVEPVPQPPTAEGDEWKKG